MNHKPVDRIDPRNLPAVQQLRKALLEDAARLHALWSEHSSEPLDFENQSVRVVIDIPRRNDTAADAAVACGRQLAEIMDDGPRARAALIDLLVLNMPVSFLKQLVAELEDGA
jgi:hypothetical protein